MSSSIDGGRPISVYSSAMQNGYSLLKSILFILCSFIDLTITSCSALEMS